MLVAASVRFLQLGAAFLAEGMSCFFPKRLCFKIKTACLGDTPPWVQQISGQDAHAVEVGSAFDVVVKFNVRARAIGG